MKPTGDLRGYRMMPHDFPQTFARVGWDGIEYECRAHKTTIKRWMVEYGEPELQRMRREFLEAKAIETGRRVPGVKPGSRIGAKYWDGDADAARKRTRAKRYVLGRTLSAVNVGKVEG